MQLENNLNCAVVQETVFVSSCLPMFHEAVLKETSNISALLKELPEEWPYEDRVLAWLVPNMKEDILKFHSDIGPCLRELYDIEVIKKLDLMMSRELHSKIEGIFCSKRDIMCEETMKIIIEDIRAKLSNNQYKNEEHVRLSLVARVVQALGWNIWNPVEVNCEFNTVPNEDKTRVDMALFLNVYHPAVFIEIKSVGKMESILKDVEKQVRDYNRNNTATFSIITDGQKWRFYSSQTPGEFYQKMFKTIDLLSLDSSINDIEQAFYTFLSKENIVSGRAFSEADKYLHLNQKERVMKDELPRAKIDAENEPNISLVDHFVKRMTKVNFEISHGDATDFIKSIKLIQAPFGSSPQISLASVTVTPNISLVAQPRPPVAKGTNLALTKMGRVIARGYEAQNGFVVETGSQAVTQLHKSAGEKIEKLRLDMIRQGKFQQTSEGLFLTCDHVFNSSSQAACVFLGCSASGPREWKKE